MYEFTRQVLGEQPTAVIRGKVAVEDMPTWFGHVYAVTAQVIGRAGATIVGPPFARYWSLGDDQFDVEAGFPVSSRIAASGEVEPSVLPGGPAVTTWHVGPYDTLRDAYEAVSRWLAEQGCSEREPAWECYVSEPIGDAATWRTLVVQPYRDA